MEQDRCGQCGGPRDLCDQPAEWYPQRDKCTRTAAREVAMRQWKSKHEKARPDGDGYLPGDGVRIYMSDVDREPDAEFP